MTTPNHDASKPRLLTVGEAAAISNIPTFLISALCNQGLIKHQRIGTGIRIDQADLLAYIESWELEQGKHDDWWKRGEDPPEFET